MSSAAAVVERQESGRRAARAALAICADADRLAREAIAASTASAADDDSADEDRLLRLMDQRDALLTDLADQLVVLRHARPADDSAHFSRTERTLDEVDALIAEVMAAVAQSERETHALTAHLARRADELRAELGQMQRVRMASAGYAAVTPTHQAVNRTF